VSAPRRLLLPDHLDVSCTQYGSDRFGNYLGRSKLTLIDRMACMGEVEADPTTLLTSAGDDVLMVGPVSRAVSLLCDNGAVLSKTVGECRKTSRCSLIVRFVFRC
jgi:hypothetical protein